MKIRSKNLNILAIVLALGLLCLSVFHITFSYFTVMKSVTGTSNFATMTFNCGYMTSDGKETWVSDDAILLYPVKSDGNSVVLDNSQLIRGQSFRLGGLNYSDEIDFADIQTDTLDSTCNVYVRFWIDAFVVENGVVNESENYGEYFIVGLDYWEFEENTFLTRIGDTYFYEEEVSPSVMVYFNALKLSESAPTEMLNETLRLFVTFEAVQATNQAYKSVFNDDRGYLSSWA